MKRAKPTLKHIIITALVLVAFGVVMRLVPHPWNTTPLIAIGLFSFHVLSHRWAWLLPVLALGITDVWLGLYSWKLMLVVYAAFGITSWFGGLIAGRGPEKKISMITAALAASSFFFLATNFAVWILSVWYPHTLAGLMQAYLMGLPFFRNMLLGDVVYTLGLFSVYELVMGYAVLPRLSSKSPFIYYQHKRQTIL